MEHKEQGKRPSTGTVREAREVIGELREALAQGGITLPSLGLDAVTLAAEPPRPLVELGRCTVETARLLAAVLRGEAGR